MDIFQHLFCSRPLFLRGTIHGKKAIKPFVAYGSIYYHRCYGLAAEIIQISNEDIPYVQLHTPFHLKGFAPFEYGRGPYPREV